MLETPDGPEHDHSLRVTGQCPKRAAQVAPRATPQTAPSEAHLDLNEFAQLCLDSPSLMGLDVTEEEEEEVVGCVEINQCVGCSDATVLAPSSGDGRAVKL